MVSCWSLLGCSGFNLPDEDHLLLQLAILVELGADFPVKAGRKRRGVGELLVEHASEARAVDVLQ